MPLDSRLALRIVGQTLREAPVRPENQLTLHTETGGSKDGEIQTIWYLSSPGEWIGSSV